MKTYYAELDTSFETTDEMKAAGPCGDVEGGIDLWRFNYKNERDEFVSENSNSNAISAADAKVKHSKQFRYWAN